MTFRPTLNGRQTNSAPSSWGTRAASGAWSRSSIKCSGLPTNPSPSVLAAWPRPSFYRLLDVEELTDTLLFEVHRQAVLRRGQQSGCRVLLAIQDTTAYNFNTRDALEGLGSISSSKVRPNIAGLHVHSPLLSAADEDAVLGCWRPSSTSANCRAKGAVWARTTANPSRARKACAGLRAWSWPGRPGTSSTPSPISGANFAPTNLWVKLSSEVRAPRGFGVRCQLRHGTGDGLKFFATLTRPYVAPTR